MKFFNSLTLRTTFFSVLSVASCLKPFLLQLPLLAPTCIYLHQLAVKKLCGNPTQLHKLRTLMSAYVRLCLPKKVIFRNFKKMLPAEPSMPQALIKIAFRKLRFSSLILKSIFFLVGPGALFLVGLGALRRASSLASFGVFRGPPIGTLAWLSSPFPR